MHPRFRSFLIGHSAYSGANAPAAAQTMTEAVRLLRLRGATRDDARRAVREADAGSHACVRGGPLGLDIIEIRSIAP